MAEFEDPDELDVDAELDCFATDALSDKSPRPCESSADASCDIDASACAPLDLRLLPLLLFLISSVLLLQLRLLTVVAFLPKPSTPLRACLNCVLVLSPNTSHFCSSIESALCALLKLFVPLPKP